MYMILFRRVGAPSASIRYYTSERSREAYLTTTEIVALLNIIRIDALSDTNHPNELVDIITAVADVTTKDNEDIVDIEGLKNRISVVLIAAQSLQMNAQRNKYSTNRSNMGVVPCVVIHNDGTITHTSHLVAVIPPKEVPGRRRAGDTRRRTWRAQECCIASKSRSLCNHP